MSQIDLISESVSRWGDVGGHDDLSSSAHAVWRRRQTSNRLGDTPRNRGNRSQRDTRARSIDDAQNLQLRLSVAQPLC